MRGKARNGCIELLRKRLCWRARFSKGSILIWPYCAHLYVSINEEKHQFSVSLTCESADRFIPSQCYFSSIPALIFAWITFCGFAILRILHFYVHSCWPLCRTYPLMLRPLQRYPINQSINQSNQSINQYIAFLLCRRSLGYTLLYAYWACYYNFVTITTIAKISTDV